jgi:diguanylate cyclase (GGDEF)-like protein
MRRGRLLRLAFIAGLLVSAAARAADPLPLAQAKLLECRSADAPADAYRAVEAGLAHADQAKSGRLRAELLTCRGDALRTDGRLRDAETDFSAAIAVASKAGEASAEAIARSGLATLQYHRGAMADALANLQIAYRIHERGGDQRRRLDTLMNMANVYADAKVAQYDRALEYYRQLVIEYEKLGKPNDLADTLFNIGTTLQTQGNPAAAERHYLRALAIFEQLKAAGDVAYTRCALGLSLVKQNRANESLPYFAASLAYYEKQPDPESIAWVRQYRGIAYRTLQRPADALRDLGAAREYYEKEKNTRFLEKNVDEAALAYEQLGDWRNAYAFRKRHATLQQELAVSRRDELSSRLRVEFDAQKKEQENRALTRENSLRVTALREAQRNQQLQLAVIGLTALLAIALALLFWRQVANTRRMRSMAMTDELTRLPNRRHILTAVEMAFAEARRNGHSASLIVLDIDHFKRINDTYGHAAGDEILRRVARTCRLTLRPSDQIGRIGGEEFLIVLHGAATARQAAEVAERLRVAVEQLDVSSIAADLRVTISLGVYVTTEYDVNAAIAAADTLLYRAKEDGRNRVEAAMAGSF